MNKFILSILLLSVAALGCTGCVSSSSLETDSAFGRSVERLVERHDKWVAADTSIDETTRGAYLSESGDVRTLIRQPVVESADLSAVVGPVLNRYEDYLSGVRPRNEELDELKLDVYWWTAQQVKDTLRIASGSLSTGGYDATYRRQ